MAFLMSAVDVARPSGVWEWFLSDVFGFIANYGWRIVVFVILLKLVLSPLDFYQKYKMRKNQRITEALKPQLDKLEKQYGEDKNTLRQKQMELNKKAGLSYMSSCLPLIVTLVLFITFYTALRSVSAYMEFKEYVEMYDSYVTEYEHTGFDYEENIHSSYYLSDENLTDEQEKEIHEWLKELLKDEESIKACIDANSENISALKKTDVALFNRYKNEFIATGKSYKDFVAQYKGRLDKNEEGRITEDGNFVYAMSILMQIKAQDAAAETFERTRAENQFLWVKSLWVADVPWLDSIPDWNTFKNSVTSGKNNYLDWSSNPGKVYEDNQTLFDDMVLGSTYNIVTSKVRAREDLSKTNGYLIMAVLILALSLLSQFISMRQQKKSGQAVQQGMGMMKMMMFLMPVMLGVFAITSSSAFTVYMIVNSAMSLIINLITTLIVNLMDGSFKKKDTVIVKHGRVDPNDRINNNNRSKK